MTLGSIEVALSFAEDSEPFCGRLAERLARTRRVYYYKNYLDQQRGLSLPPLAAMIYGSVPVIVMRTLGWQRSAACQLELASMEASESPLLVVNFLPNETHEFRLTNREVLSIDGSSSDQEVFVAAQRWVDRTFFRG